MCVYCACMWAHDITTSSLPISTKAVPLEAACAVLAVLLWLLLWLFLPRLWYLCCIFFLFVAGNLKKEEGRFSDGSGKRTSFDEHV